MKCQICNQEITNVSNHYRKGPCAEAWTLYFSSLIPEIKKDFESHSMLDLVKKYNERVQKDGWQRGIKYSYLEKNLANIGLHRTLKESNKQFTAIKGKEYYQKHYGVDNVSQLQNIKDKKAKTTFEHYGVENPAWMTDFAEKANKTKLEHYGTLRPQGSSNGRLSKPHKIVSDYLTSLGIQHLNEYNGIHYKKDGILKNPIPDIFIPEFNLIIEINGDFWHANPERYKPTDIFPTWEGKKTAQEIWDHDSEKLNIYKELNYNFLVIWEHSIKDSDYIITLNQKLKEVGYGTE